MFTSANVYPLENYTLEERPPQDEDGRLLTASGTPLVGESVDAENGGPVGGSESGATSSTSSGTGGSGGAEIGGIGGIGGTGGASGGMANGENGATFSEPLTAGVGVRVSGSRDLSGEYATYGMRRSVYGVALVHLHSHPHVLVLQTSPQDAQGAPPPRYFDSIFPTGFVLPGGPLSPGEDERDGLVRMLEERIGVDPARVAAARDLEARGIVLGPESGAGKGGKGSSLDDLVKPWVVGELLSEWWRPSHTANNVYPYRPVHVSNPKENIKVFHVHLPPQRVFGIPSNHSLTAIPLMELLHNAHTYAPILASAPLTLSRYALSAIVDAADDDDGPIPGAGNDSDDSSFSDEDDSDDENLQLATAVLAQTTVVAGMDIASSDSDDDVVAL